MHGPQHEAIRKRYIEERYRLLPYIYTSMEQTSRDGIPLMRPMFLEYPDQEPLITEGEDDVTTGEHPMVERALRAAARRLGGFYNFEGLRRFKSKFVPSYWECEYALGQRGVAMPPRVGHAVVRALVPGGLTQLLTRQALRITRLENVTKTLSSASKPAKSSDR